MSAKRIALALLVSSIATSSALGTSPNWPLIWAEAAAEDASEFGIDLYRRLAADSDGNLFLSPTSIHICLGMAYAGAGGRTAQQMKQALSVEVPNAAVFRRLGCLANYLNRPHETGGKKAYELSIANALWVQKGLAVEEPFANILKTGFEAAHHEANFRTQTEAARKAINEWVEQKTADKIKNLVPAGALKAATRLVLANAIYFKSNWMHAFKESRTTQEDFTLSPGKTIKTAMMHQQRSFGYLETDSFQSLELPYLAGDLSMVVFLPKEVAGLAALEKSLTAKAIAEWMGKIKRAEVAVAMPKFEFTSEFNFNKTLAAMGMPDAFDPDQADFSGITKAEKLFISAVLHKAFVAVDEKGTEAAAATAVIMAGGAAPAPAEPKVFTADHPFIFLIRHRQTRAILFMGRVANPKEQ